MKGIALLLACFPVIGVAETGPVGAPASATATVVLDDECRIGLTGRAVGHPKLSGAREGVILAEFTLTMCSGTAWVSPSVPGRAGLRYHDQRGYQGKL